MQNRKGHLPEMSLVLSWWMLDANGFFAGIANGDGIMAKTRGSLVTRRRLRN